MLQRLFHRCEAIISMDDVEIDIVRPQTFQTRVTRREMFDRESPASIMA